MKPWRPDNFNAVEIARPIKDAEPSGKWVSQLDVALVEAGADAMLESLASLVGEDGYISFEKEDGKVVAVYIDD